MSLWETFQLEHERLPKKRCIKVSHKEQRGVTTNTHSTALDYSRCPSTSRPTGSYIPSNSSQQQQRQQQRQRGHRLIQHRLFKNNQELRDRYRDGTNAVYRQREDWGRQQGYAACAILNHERVVGWDCSGALDVVKVPLFSSSKTQTRPLGTAVVDALDLKQHHLLQPTRNHPKLYPFQGGDALAVGCGTVYHILTSERLRTWGQDRQLPRANIFHPSYSTYAISGPRRKYERNLQKSEYSLRAMAKTQTSYYSTLDYDTIFSVLPDWNLVGVPKLPYPPFVPPIRRPIPLSSQWAFFETGSSLLAARVDPQQDAFWIRLMDDRTVHQPVVVISRSVPPRYCDEHTTAIEFVSQNCIITAHVTCPSSSNTSSMATPVNGTQRGQKTETCVKLWDIRKASSLVARDQENDSASVDILSLPAFPCDTALGLDHEAELPFRGEYDGRQDAFITALSSSGNGTVMVTAQTSEVADHSLLHLGRLDWTHIHRQQDIQESLLFSVAGNHAVLACVESPDAITLIDVVASSALGARVPSGLKSSSNKRHFDGSTNKGDETVSQNRMLSTILKDRLGLDTEFSCLAMNADGSAIVGGSTDGDLFVWRSD